jgi:hypothetical protein
VRNTAANVVRLPNRQPVKLDEGPATVRLVQAEIFRCGWTYARIGFEADLCQSTVMKIAQGETTRPALRTIMKILIALGWEVYASERR